jgi:hypothetical protein
MKANLDKQSTWWRYAAGTIPSVVVAVLVLLDIIGWSGEYNKIIFIILLSFFTTGVLWWWWAIDKILELSKLLLDTEKKFTELTTEIKLIQTELNSIDGPTNN